MDFTNFGQEGFAAGPINIDGGHRSLTASEYLILHLFDTEPVGPNDGEHLGQNADLIKVADIEHDASGGVGVEIDTVADCPRGIGIDHSDRLARHQGRRGSLAHSWL